ncbi:MAG TPA: nucleotide exchange factor GrpE [Bacteroidales bacterium]|nr:nucleotide exchange factor GrpE [Bacteroidales bacterium]
MSEKDIPEKPEPGDENLDEYLTQDDGEAVPEEVAGSGENKDKAARHKHRKEEELKKLEAEVAELKDKYLRLYSEFDNYRKRTLKEKIELSKLASAGIITSLLPVIDDLERAIKAFGSGGEDSTHLKDGVLLIYNKWMNILTQEGLEPIVSVGEDFNTDLHEAVTNIPAPDPAQKGKVLEEISKGYKLNGKVIRYAKVVVGS